jgi:hypothetical protein
LHFELCICPPLFNTVIQHRYSTPSAENTGVVVNNRQQVLRFGAEPDTVTVSQSVRPTARFAGSLRRLEGKNHQ